MNDLKYYIDNYKNTIESNSKIISEFIDDYLSIAFLKEHRTFIENNKMGYGESCFHYLWYLLVNELPDNFNFLEIGVYKGQITSLISILAKYYNKKCSIYGITPLDSTDNHPDIDYLSEITKLYKQFNLDVNIDLKIIKGLSQDKNIIEEAKKIEYDMIFIDGGHDYDIIKNDIINYTPLLKKNGYLIIDDCANNMNTEFWYKGKQEVSDAVSELIETNKNFNHLLCLAHDRVWQKI